MKRFVAAVVFFAVFIALCVIPHAISGPVNPGAQALETQLTPAGHANTTQTAFVQTSTGAAAANTITVAGLSGKNIFVTGFEITGDGSTAGTPITITLAFGGTTVGNYSLTPGAIATLATVQEDIEFTVPVTSGAPGGNCVLTVPSFGSGNTAASVTIHGFYQ
jgi:hypothetical protein